MNQSNQDVTHQVIESIHIENEHAFVSSKAVAEHFGKSHKDVLRAISNVGCSDSFRERNFAPSVYSVKTGIGKERTYKCYNLTRDGFIFTVMGFTGKKADLFKEAYINAFNKMEAALLGNQLGCGINPENYHFPLETADPKTRVLKNVIMTPRVLLDNRKPEIELIEQLEQDGFDVSGVKVRIEALYALAQYQVFYNEMFTELHTSLDRVTQLANSHRQTVWGKNVNFTTPFQQGVKRLGC